jgi:hypothetical protein
MHSNIEERFSILPEVDKFFPLTSCPLNGLANVPLVVRDGIVDDGDNNGGGLLSLGLGNGCAVGCTGGSIDELLVGGGELFGGGIGLLGDAGLLGKTPGAVGL